MIAHAMPNPVQVALQRAADATGVDLSFLLGTAKRESGYNAAAKAPTSSATGLFQFVDQSWLATVKKHGARYGYARYARLIDKGPDGRWRPVDASARQVLMSLRLDPHANALMAGEMAADHATYLRGRLGRAPTPGELYLAHFLGAEGSARLIAATRTAPTASAAAMFPDAARANPSLFYRAGQPMSIAGVYAHLVTGERGPPPSSAKGDEAFLRYAAARRAESQARHRAVAEAVLRRPPSRLEAASPS
jgi:hypothetical protein